MESQSPVFQVTPENFQAEVVERSQQLPVLLLFWADQVMESRDTRQTLETLVRQYAGKVVLGLVDVAQDQTLAQHLRVQGLPSLRVVQGGQIVQQADGPQPESAFKALLDQLTLSPADLLQAELAEVLERRDFDTAITMLRQALKEEPQNDAARVELADVLIRAGRLDDGRELLAVVPEAADERERPQTRLELHEEAAALGTRAEAEQALAGDPDDLEACYRLAVLAAVAEDYEAGLEQAMHILQRDRKFRDDIGRLTMIRIFTLMGKGSELASKYRRRMFAFMH